MEEIKYGTCPKCGRRNVEIYQACYSYNIWCRCCGGPYHSEIVEYCKECGPTAPERISAEVAPIKVRPNINPENWDYYD